ncbi:MAG: DMT family transporter [Lachnospiraceae bacterium]|nr:DMT family transporter [Lachnospiraceae bacterium]
MYKKKVAAIFYAILAAVFYAVNMPASKVLLKNVEPAMMAALLYLGAGIGIGMLFLFYKDKNNAGENLTREDLPYTISMIVLDIIAPVFLMFGLLYTTSANASLLNNFEIVATSMIALVVFKEMISKRLWIAVFLVTLSSAILSFEDMSSLKFSWGSLLVLLAACCWGLENNCTRRISSRNVYEIVTLKGIFSGLGSFVISQISGEHLPAFQYCIAALILGFFAYGLSIFFYIKAQNVLGAAKTSAYYAIAPFIGALLSFVFLKEALTVNYLAALVIMLLGSAIVVIDTMILYHTHKHTHTITHTHDGSTHTHTIAHSHVHSHFGPNGQHRHAHGLEITTHHVHG